MANAEPTLEECKRHFSSVFVVVVAALVKCLLLLLIFYAIFFLFFFVRFLHMRVSLHLESRDTFIIRLNDGILR